MKEIEGIQQDETELFQELNALVEQSRVQAVAQVNSTLTLLFWKIGHRVNEYILEGQRAEYGKQIVVALARQLQERHGRSFAEKNLRRMLQFASIYPEQEIVVSLTRQLSWTHIVALLPLKTAAERDFYAERIVEEQWNTRYTRKQIEQKAYERSAIANTQLPDTAHQLSGSFKDPYLLDFLSLPTGYLEKDLENAILQELEQFILEIGKGFAFVERQKRMIIDDEDYYLDLLFFHRKLKRLVAIELKIGKFQAKHKGQMELYLKWLNKYEKQAGEEAPIGLILCAETSREQVELLEMHKDGIMVAEYWTELPPRKELETRLHDAYLNAKEIVSKQKLLE